MEQPADMETLRDLATHQRKTAEYLQMLAGKFLTYEQQQREDNQAQSRRLEQQIAALVQAAQTMAGSGQRLVSETVKGVEAGTRNAIAEATQSQLHTLQEAAKRFAAGVHDAGAAIDRQRSSLESVRHGLLWKLSVPLAVGALLCALGGGAWLWFAAAKARQAQQQADRAQMQAQMVTAINQADVQLCDGKLCVNIDRRDKRVVAGKTYYVAVERAEQAER